MKAEGWTFVIIGGFLGLVGPIYFFLSHEVIGLVALLLTGVMGLMIATYLFITGRKMDARPEDRKNAEIIEGAGDLGFFPPKSIWPLWVALTLSIMVLGPVFGWWLTIIGAALGVWSLTGWVFEFYRGDYQH